MRIYMVLQWSKGLEATFANWTFMWPLFRMRLHMSWQEVTFRGGVIAVITHVCLSNLQWYRYIWCIWNFLTYLKITNIHIIRKVVLKRLLLPSEIVSQLLWSSCRLWWIHLRRWDHLDPHQNHKHRLPRLHPGYPIYYFRPFHPLAAARSVHN